MIPNLPQELTEVIVDYLYDDVHSLEACSTASRSLLEPARFHLFSSIVLNTKQRLTRFVAFENNSPTVRTHLRYLAVRKPQIEPGFTPIDSGDLAKVLSLDLQVRSLVFFNFIWDFQINCNVLDSVAELTLDWCTFSDFSSFQDFIMLFPHLSTLRAVCTTWEKHKNSYQDVTSLISPSSSYLGPQAPRLRNLVVSHSKLVPLGRWLVASNAAERLDSIDLSIYGESEFGECARLIDAAGRSLRRVSMGALSDNRGWKGQSVVTDNKYTLLT